MDRTEYAYEERALGLFSTDLWGKNSDCYMMSSFRDKDGYRIFIFYLQRTEDEDWGYLCHYEPTEIFENAIHQPPQHMIYERE